MVGRISFFDREWAKYPEERRGVTTTDYLAHLWRESPTLQDAIRRWEAENPETEKLAAAQKEAALAAVIDLLKKETARPLLDVNALTEADRPRPMNELPGADEWRLARASGKEWSEALEKVPKDSPFRRILAMAEEASRRAALRAAFRMQVDKLSAASSADARREVARSLLSELGDSPSFDFMGMWKNLMQLLDLLTREVAASANTENSRPPSLAVLMIDIEWVLLPLLVAFHDPREFFLQAWPMLEPRAADEESVSSLLRRWGLAVLLNPSVRARFVECGERPGFLTELVDLEDRRPFRGSGGRKKSADTRDYTALSRAYYSLPKGRRRRWIEAEAKKLPQVASRSLERLIRKHRPK